MLCIEDSNIGAFNRRGRQGKVGGGIAPKPVLSPRALAKLQQQAEKEKEQFNNYVKSRQMKVE